ncbi:MAG: hypothetical protein JNM78_06175 [Cyclobacteriaceae bacterium]|nr:hypothetical protein [Cyclobacteriaceae bacterium]
MKFIPFILLLVLSCTPKPTIQINEEVGDTLATQNITVIAYQDSLHHLPFTPHSSLHALEIFRDQVDKHDLNANDKIFQEYLYYQVILIDSLYNQLVKRPDHEKIESLIWADESLHDPVGLQYERELNQYGLILKSTEGFIYISRSTQPLRTFFYDHLSSATQEFFDQFEAETMQDLSEDGMLLITPVELAQRLAFWEEFLTKYPEHLFAQFARNNVTDYQYYLLEGMDNTPAFDFETNKIQPEFLEAYTFLNQHYPTLICTHVCNQYLALLKQSDYKRTEEVSRFIEQHRK